MFLSATTPLGRSNAMRAVAGIACACALWMAASALVAAEPSVSQPSAASALRVQTYSAGGVNGAPKLQIRMTLDHTAMTVADRVVLRITALSEPTAQITLPEIGSTLGDFTVASSDQARVDAASEMAGIEFRVVLEPFLSGDKNIPPLKITANAAGKTTSITTDAFKVAVTDVLPVSNTQPAQQGPPALAPAKPPVELSEPVSAPRWILPAVGIAAAALIGSACVWFVAGRRKGKRKQDPVTAFRAVIDAARERVLPGIAAAEAGGEAALDQLAAGLRVYLQDHLRIPAAGASSPELAAHIRRSPVISDGARSCIDRLLIQLDGIRFAPAAIDGSRAHQLVEDAATFLDLTSAPIAETARSQVHQEVAA
jgi:hypothetical protein